MKAMVATDFGPPDVLKMQQIDAPTPDEHDVLIDVHAAAVNPVDTKIRQGYLTDRQPPIVLGYDVSGTVRAVGENVDRLKAGDAVYASPALVRDGSNAEQVAVDARTVARKPENLAHTEAAALPLVTITAWEALHHRARMHESETVLVHGGAGGVGHIALQLANLHGCHVITTAGNDESEAMCKQLGADRVIRYDKQDVVKTVQDATDGKGCAVVFDTVGGQVFNTSVDCLAVHGRLVAILPPPDDAPMQKLFIKDATIVLEFMGAPTMFHTHPEAQGQLLSTVTELVEAGKLRPTVSHTFALDQLADAHRQQETGHTHGKIAITVQ